jgi:putative cardiolipin synthase
MHRLNFSILGKIVRLTIATLGLSYILVGCVTTSTEVCPEGTLDFPGCPPVGSVEDKEINALYTQRQWLSGDDLEFDPIEMGENAKIPINSARVKLLGPSRDDALNSLAARIWLIEHAEHTIDLTYYIFKRDPVGYSILGALCNAVKRGVDIRIMVDSLGSMHPTHSELKALESCAYDAGFMRARGGEPTTQQASVQVVIFNAMTKFNFNRRSHDKLLVVDGHFLDKAAIITGGRNISLDYYGITEDGSPDPTAFRDMELLLKPGLHSDQQELTVADVSEHYFSLLFLYEGNKRLRIKSEQHNKGATKIPRKYRSELEKAQKHLVFIKNIPEISSRLDSMTEYMDEGFHDASVRLAHQLSNMTAENVTTDVRENIDKNPNSINYLLEKIARKALAGGEISGTIRIVSPYLFCARYYDDNDVLIYDGAKELHQFLAKHPNVKIEVVTNSVLTSDNFLAQSIIDMDMAPRLLLDPSMEESWISGLDEGELESEVVKSESWRNMINHPQISIYQTGRSDSVEIGGDVVYGKLHAKYIVGEKGGFVGTSNFDYRSNLYNNEMGFFFVGDGVENDLVTVFNELKATSYLWGTPEWLEMREKLMSSDSGKAGPARKQRIIFKTVRTLGLEYLM